MKVYTETFQTSEPLYTCVFMYVYIYIYIYICTDRHGAVCICVHIHIYAVTNAGNFVPGVVFLTHYRYAYECKGLCVHTCVHMCVYIYIYIHTYGTPPHGSTFFVCLGAPPHENGGSLRGG